IDAGNLDTRQERNALLDQLTRQPPRRLLVVCDAMQTPDRGTTGLVAELARIVPLARVWLHGDADQKRIEQWTQRLVQAGIPRESLDTRGQAALAWLTEHDPVGESHA